jgi:hypothetical protein
MCRAVTAGADQQVPGQQRAPGPGPVTDGGGELRPPPHPCLHGKHCCPPAGHRCRTSDADPCPALAPPRRQHRPARPGPHAQPEPVRLGAPAVIRLERSLAHRNSSSALLGLSRSHRPGAGTREQGQVAGCVQGTGRANRQSNRRTPLPCPRARLSWQTGCLRNTAPAAPVGCGQPIPGGARQAGPGCDDSARRITVPGTPRNPTCTTCGQSC